MQIDLTALPEDAATLQRMLRTVLLEQGELHAENDKLRLLIQRLMRHQFGRRSEQLTPDQLQLALEELVPGDNYDEERYRHWCLPLTLSGESRDVAGEHDAILRAVLARSADEACTLMRGHIQRTTDILAQSPIIHEGA